MLRVAEAEKLAAFDTEEALNVLLPVDRTFAFPSLLKLAGQFVKMDPVRGLRFAEEAVLRARAMELPAEDFRGWSNYGGRSVFAAWAGGQAEIVGYPDMASIVARVLACRPTERGGWSDVNLLEAPGAHGQGLSSY